MLEIQSSDRIWKVIVMPEPGIESYFSLLNATIIPHDENTPPKQNETGYTRLPRSDKVMIRIMHGGRGDKVELKNRGYANGDGGYTLYSNPRLGIFYKRPENRDGIPHDFRAAKIDYGIFWAVGLLPGYTDDSPAGRFHQDRVMKILDFVYGNHVSQTKSRFPAINSKNIASKLNRIPLLGNKLYHSLTTDEFEPNVPPANLPINVTDVLTRYIKMNDPFFTESIFSLPEFSVDTSESEGDLERAVGISFKDLTEGDPVMTGLINHILNDPSMHIDKRQRKARKAIVEQLSEPIEPDLWELYQDAPLLTTEEVLTRYDRATEKMFTDKYFSNYG